MKLDGSRKGLRILGLRGHAGGGWWHGPWSLSGEWIDNAFGTGTLAVLKNAALLRHDKEGFMDKGRIFSTRKSQNEYCKYCVWWDYSYKYCNRHKENMGEWETCRDFKRAS